MIAKLPAPKAILFDWDNTLVDTWPCIGKAINVTLEAMGQTPWTDSEIRVRVAGSLRDTFPALFGDRWQEARDIFYKTFGEVHLQMLIPTPGAGDLLTALAGEGVYLGVVSNKTGRFLRTEAEHLGWSRYFHRVVGAQDAPRDKPACDPVHMALEGSGITAGPAVWFVGDGPIDVQCGKETGCTTVLVHPHAPHQPEFAGLQPDAHATDCYNLRSLALTALGHATP